MMSLDICFINLCNLFQSRIPLLRYRHHIALSNFNHLLERQLPNLLRTWLHLQLLVAADVDVKDPVVPTKTGVTQKCSTNILEGYVFSLSNGSVCEKLSALEFYESNLNLSIKKRSSVGIRMNFGHPKFLT